MVSTHESFTEFAARIEQIEHAKEDYVLDTQAVTMVEPERLSVDGLGEYDLLPHASGQLADRLQIPRKFWERTAGYDGLREEIVNRMLRQKPERRMLRTLEGNARAWLSDRFRPIDNMFILNGIIPTLAQYPDLEVASRGLTDKRMYLQVTFPSLEREVVVGDPVRAGITITNSEVGAGAVNVELMIWRLVCKNGMVGASLLRNTHIGRRLELDNESTYEIFKDDTVEAETRSMQLRLRDVVASALDESRFDKEVEKLRSAAADKIEDPEPVIENVTKRFALPESCSSALLMNMAEERNLNRYGLANAVTNWAQSLDDRDAQYDAERTGSRIIDLPHREWVELIA